MTVVLIMLFWRSLIVLKNMLIVVFFLLYSRSSRELHNIKSYKTFSLLFKAYIMKFSLTDLYFNWNLFLLSLWNLIVDSSIAKWLSEIMNRNSWILKIFRTNLIFQNHKTLLYNIWKLNSTFRWCFKVWYQ